jgi:hypothetical protein
MNALDHPLVTDWLRRYDRAARDIPSPRREALRSELTDHLLEAIEPVDDATATAVLKDLGDPAVIVASERAAADEVDVAPRTRLRRRTLMIGAIVFIIVAVLLAAVLPAVIGADIFAGPDVNVVTTHPHGPDRVTDGRGYQEYLAEIRTLPPLPAGASWPEGVTAGLDAGPTADGNGVMSAGGGTSTADFTWGCAWEYEYVLAEKAGDDERLVAAYDAIVRFGDSPMMMAASPDGGWKMNVIDPLTFEDSSGLKADVVQTCGQAGILGV